MLCGDAGIGKSSVLDAAVLRADGLRVLRSGCDALTTPRPLGPFRDLAADLGLRELFRGDVQPSRVFEDLDDALASQPTVLVVEDVHWADAASVEVLRFLVRRLDAVPLVVLVSYRDHEIAHGHSARPLLGDLARLEGTTTLRLDPLSPAAVRSLVGGTGLDPLRVHDVTGGNPYFVCEVVKEPGRPLPTSVRDAVLARTADVAPEDFEVLQLVSAAPDRLDDRLLPALGVDLPPLRRLDATGLITRDRAGLVFRHELARQAVESTVPPGGASRLHARLPDALETVGVAEPALLTHHAVAARDAGRAHRYARAAAEEAVRAGAHSEAAAFLRTALDHLVDEAPGERADLLQQLSVEQYMTGRLADAIENVRATFLLWHRAGDDAGLARAYETAAVYAYYNARRREAEAYAERAVGIVDRPDAAPGESSLLALAAARATRGFLAYMRSEPDRALAGSSDAGRIAQELGNQPLALRAQLVRAVTALASGDAEARATVAECIEEARLRSLDELASTGYSQLANIDVEQHRLRAAEHVLDDAQLFSVERDILICRHWQTGVRARMRFAQGRWSAALEDAGSVLDEAGMPIARLWPLLVHGLVPLRRNRSGGTELDEAWTLAAQIDEPLRRGAVLCALAERMWLTGSVDDRVTRDAVAVVTGPAPAATAWLVGELAVWLHRLGLQAVPAVPVPEPFRSALAGRAEDAADWCHRAGEPFQEAMARADAADPAQRVRAVEQLDLLGATATADRVRADLRRDGVTQLPARPRASSVANPAGLTNRQLDVARLVARGLTNAEIAARLFISPKTTDHHVSAVLTKLGLPNRRAVVLRADDLGLA